MTDKWPDNTYILIPSYKSITQLRPFMDELTMFVPKSHICVVDDASNDGTYEYCVDFGVACLRHCVNRGKGAALRTGFAYLTGGGIEGINTHGTDIDINTNITKNIAQSKNAKWILTMDADGQHSPADLHRFVKESVNHPNMGLCIGCRDMRIGVMPPARIVSNRLTSAILSLLTWRVIKDSQCGYRLYSRELILSTHTRYGRFQMESEIIIKAAAKNFPVRFVRVQTLYFKDGASHISHIADTLRWVTAVLRARINTKTAKNCNK